MLAAGLTATVSCGALALAVWRGWLGPDVGRGATFCEAARDSLVRQPANTFSNLGFVVAGLLIAWHAAGTPRAGMVLSRPLATAMGCLVVLLGPASAAMHATQSSLGGHLDMLSMYLLASFAVAYATMRWRRRGSGLMAAVFVAALAVCELVGLSGPAIPVVMTSGNAVFGILLLVAVVLEVIVIRRGETRTQRGYVYASLGSLLVAFGIWNAEKSWLCDPSSPVQGHAIWHLLDALAAYLLYRYYASEQAGGRAGHPALPERLTSAEPAQ